MRFIKVVLICSLLSSCGAISRKFTSITGGLTYKCNNQGVEYVQADSGIALSVDRQGMPVRCEL